MIYSSYLYGMYGFGLEETGNYHAAEKSAKLVRVIFFVAMIYMMTFSKCWFMNFTVTIMKCILVKDKRIL